MFSFNVFFAWFFVIMVFFYVFYVFTAFSMFFNVVLMFFNGFPCIFNVFYHRFRLMTPEPLKDKDCGPDWAPSSDIQEEHNIGAGEAYFDYDRVEVGWSKVEGRWRKDGGNSTKVEESGGGLWREIWRKVKTFGSKIENFFFIYFFKVLRFGGVKLEVFFCFVLRLG